MADYGNQQGTISEVDFEAGVENLKQRRATTSLNANWCQLKGGKATNGRGACHGSLRLSGYDAIATMNHWRDCPSNYGYEYRAPGSDYGKKATADLSKSLPLEIGERWCDWLFNRSWAAPYFVAPSFEFARDVGFLFTTENPGNICLALATLGRHASEQRHRVRKWYDLLQKYPEMSEDMAYAVAFGIQTSDDPYGSIIGGHCTLFVNSNLAYLKNVVDRKIDHTTQSGRLGGTKTGVNAMWGAASYRLTDELKALKPAVKTTGVVIANPFTPVVKTSNEISEELLTETLPAIIDYFQSKRKQRAA